MQRKGAVLLRFLALSLVVGLASPFFSKCVENRSLRQFAKPPGFISIQFDRLWSRLGKSQFKETSKSVHELRWRIKTIFDADGIPLELEEPDESELKMHGTYGRLPTVFADRGHGALFPVPISKPEHFSWFQVNQKLLALQRELQSLFKLLKNFEELPRDTKETKAPDIRNSLYRAESLLTQIAEQIRYLETWIPQLKRQWEAAKQKNEIPHWFKTIQAITSANSKEFESLRESLRPHRIQERAFLPRNLSERRLASATPQRIFIPMATDITDRKFLREVEGALDTHWNQSPWARQNHLRFQIQWVIVPENPKYKTQTHSLIDHLNHFLKNHAILTTGGLTTHVKQHALILGPKQTDPRTIAHELGHILGFQDCYIRSLNGESLFGLSVLEWNNPLYPDDLMCDNSVGVAWAEVW